MKDTFLKQPENKMKDNKIKNIFKSTIFFVVMLILTSYMLFKDSNLTSIIETIEDVNTNYILLAIIAMCIFISCEGINILRNLNILGYNVGLIKGIKYALVGFFFSSITPSASGGQPMQVYFMKKDNIEISHSIVALLIELASFQINTVIISLLGFFLNMNFFMEKIGSIKYLLFIGITINIIAFLFIICALFNRRLMEKLLNFATKILTKLKYKNIEGFKEKSKEQLEEYASGAKYIKNNKKALIKTLMITFIQLTAMYSVTFFVYKSFGLSQFNFIQIISIQAVLYSSVMALPLPGGVGASEGGFLSLFKYIFPLTLTSPAMLLSRGINFYLFVLISGLAIMFFQLIYIKNSNMIKETS